MRPIITLVALCLLVAVSACSGGDKDAFRNVDHDKNGAVSYEELLFVFPDITPETFRSLDTNGDGQLSENEYALFLKSDLLATLNKGPGNAQSPSKNGSGASPSETSQPAVPFRGEEVIEIPAPGAEAGHGASAKGKPEKGKKDQKARPESLKKGEATQYTVARGDNLSRIAMKFGLSVEDITRANGNMAPDTLRDGQVLNIPARP